MHPGLRAPQKIHTLDLLPPLIDAKVDHQDSAVLTRADDAAVVALGGQHPTGSPFREDSDQLAAFVVIDTEIEIVRAGDDTLVLGIQKQ